MSGIFYKNRPYAGGGGGTGGASALSDLTDTSISSPTNGQVLKYNNGFWENDDESGGTTVVANPQGTASAQLNKLQVGNDIYSIPSGGGGGGSSITYGYTNPTSSASDGALYILLDDDDKEQGKFLYISNEWKLISGSAYVEAYVLYDNGTEEVPWTVSSGTKNADSIALNVGGGSFSTYAVTDDAIDLTDYAAIHIEYMFNNQSYEENVDISSYTGSKYISFTYLTDYSHNEAAIGLTDTKTGATTIRLKNNTSATVNQILYYMELR